MLRKYAELELQAALAFWRLYHNFGSRERVRNALTDLRRYR